MICVKDGGVNVIIIYSNNIIIFLAFYPRLVAKVEVKPQAPVADLERCEVLDPPGHHRVGARAEVENESVLHGSHLE